MAKRVQVTGGDECDNLECRAGLTHDRCTPDCATAPLTLRRFIAERLHGDASPAAYALRAIYAMHRPDTDGECIGCHASYQEEAWTQNIEDCPELRLIAFVWSNHAEYQRRWEPKPS